LEFNKINCVQLESVESRFLSLRQLARSQISHQVVQAAEIPRKSGRFLQELLTTSRDGRPCLNSLGPEFSEPPDFAESVRGLEIKAIQLLVL
jgi:hypothetical protein